MGLVAQLPLLSHTVAQKAMPVHILIAGSEITRCVGVTIVGKQLGYKVHKYLNPCTWFSCKKDTLHNNV